MKTDRISMRCLSVIFIGIIAFFLQIYAVGVPSYSSIEQSACESIRNNNFKIALEQMQVDTAIVDTSFRYFKLGRIYEGISDDSKAIYYFRLSAQKNPLYVPLVFERIGDIELRLKQYETSVKSYQFAYEKAHSSQHKTILFNKISSIVLLYPDKLGTMKGLAETFKIKKDTSVDSSSEYIKKKVFNQIVAADDRSKIDSLLQMFSDSFSTERVLKCYFCSLIVADKNSLNYKTLKLFQVSKIAFDCRKYSLAKKILDVVSARKDFSQVVNEKDVLSLKAQTAYYLKNYNVVISLVKKYDKLYGADADLFFQIARAYRSLGMTKQANIWYARYVALFPKKQKALEIVWFQAWQQEEKSNYEAARLLYNSIMTKFKNKGKDEDAFFRLSLTYYKEKNMALSAQSFEKFIKKYPNTSLLPAAYYWRAKSYYGLRQFDKTRQDCLELHKKWPVNFYTYRSKDLLMFLGDPLPPVIPIDTSYSIFDTEQWLDSLTKLNKKELSSEDSSMIYQSFCYAALGLMEHCKYVLDPICASQQNNYLLTYRISRLYQKHGQYYSSYRLARQFAWKVVQDSKKSLPLPLLDILYPYAYMEYVHPSAMANNIEPELVLSVIRQESIFNANAVSVVGAMGLMQIMGFTGEAIARELKQTYDRDSLVKPSFNIQFGTYYLKKLLDQFEGNVVMAVAGYNGGPHNVKEWTAINNNDGYDIFIEDLGFSETRNYVKKVLENYWTYKELKKYRSYTIRYADIQPQF